MNSSDLYFYGCGGLALEALDYLNDSNFFFIGENFALNFRGFIDQSVGSSRLDDAQTIWGDELELHDSVSSIPAHSHFLITIGDAGIRDRLYDECLTARLNPVTMSHHSAVVSSFAQIGSGVLIAPHAFVGPFAEIGDNALLNTYSSAGHDSTVGRSAVLSPYSTLNGAAQCGRCSFIGTAGVISPKISLGSYSKLSAGSVLSSDAGNGALAYGNPAKHRVLFKLPE